MNNSSAEGNMVAAQGKPFGQWARLPVALALAVAAALGGAQAALAISGESPPSVGAFQVPTAACASLRTKTGVQGDMVIACDPDGEACQIDLPNTDRETRTGIAATGFCGDTVSIKLPTSTPPGVIEQGAVVQGSSFSSITGIKPPGNVLNEAANIVCSTFTLPGPFTVGTGGNRRTYGPGVRVCRKIEPCVDCPTTPPNCGTSEQSNYFVTVVDSADPNVNDGNPCADVQAILTGTLASTPPRLAFALFNDFHSTAGGSVSRPGRQALLVCPGYRAVCISDSNRAQPNTVVDYRLPTVGVQEAYYYYDSKGYRRCISPPDPPCPK